MTSDVLWGSLLQPGKGCQFISINDLLMTSQLRLHFKSATHKLLQDTSAQVDVNYPTGVRRYIYDIRSILRLPQVVQYTSSNLNSQSCLFEGSKLAPNRTTQLALLTEPCPTNLALDQHLPFP